MYTLRDYLSRTLSLAALTAVCLLLLLQGATPTSAAGPDTTDKRAAPPPASQPDTHCTPDWSIWPSPSLGPDRNQLLSVAAVSTSDVWAVGGYLGWPYRPIIQHWDGTQWTLVPTPHLPGAALLRGVTAISASDVWAVGYYDGGNRRWRTFALHWDGTAWTQVPTPNTGSGSNYLFGVSAAAPNDVWAVGSSCCVRYEQQTLAMRWDGATWSVVPSPSVAPLSNALYGVAAISPSDAWAVGAYGAYDNRQVLIERWDGAQWSVVRSAPAGTLLAIEAISTSKLWAVGYSGSSYYRRSLAMGFDGQTWDVAPSPSPGDADNIFYDVSALSNDDVWAVGAFNNAYAPNETLIAHWDGGRWTQVPGPNNPFSENYLYAVDAISARDIWAVGETYNYYSGGSSTFAVRYQGQITFSDVYADDYFYEPVRYLYCAGAISGYADNTFRPYNNTTRGQLTKIVVLAEGWPIYTPPTPTFSDVPTTHPFYRYVETAHSRAIISGYSDGTFRPGSDVTRAQLSKIIVLAEGWETNTRGGPHFRDVPPTYPFYAYIETAYNKGIISGYDDRTFRPGTNAARGQIAKIVYMAILAP